MQSFGAVNSAIDGAGERQRLLCTRHSNVAEAPLFLEFFRIAKRAAVRECALFEAGKKNMIEFEALGGMQREQRDRCALVVIVGIAYQGGTIEKVRECFAAFGSLDHG